MIAVAGSPPKPRGGGGKRQKERRPTPARAAAFTPGRPRRARSRARGAARRRRPATISSPPAELDGRSGLRDRSSGCCEGVGPRYTGTRIPE